MNENEIHSFFLISYLPEKLKEKKKEEQGKMVLDTVNQTAVSYLVNLALEKVMSYLSNFLGDQKELELELEKIKVSLTEIRGFIEIAEGSPVLDPKLMELLERIKDAAYYAEDLLEECEIEDQRRSQEPPQKKVCNLIPAVFNRPNLTSELKDVSERLEAIKAESDKFQLVKTVKNWESKFKKERETHSFVIKSQVLGREEEKTKLLSLLLSPREDVLVIPIVGMGGIGKTTLAQFAYNHEDVDDHFNLKMWICVSDDFDFKSLQSKIIERAADAHPGGPKIIERASGAHPGGPGPSNLKKFGRAARGHPGGHLQITERAGGGHPGPGPSNCWKKFGFAADVKKFDVEELQHRLRKALSGKRFLLVLDDVWNEELDKWERLRDLLICGGRGSRIVVTTRIRKVASIMSTISPIVLEGLPDDHCWSLFSQRGLRNQREEEATHLVNLVSIGREIVKKCKGNPLAVLTLGGRLCCETDEARWAYVRDSEIWNIANENEHGILPALRLSYNHLKSHVKQCFAFCAIFPKNYEIEKEKLIKLWMANGFIPSKRGMELEDIGNEIFNELVMKSFFQDVKEDFTTYRLRGRYSPLWGLRFEERLFVDKITFFSMHDLFHDLAQSVMGNECCVAKEGKLVKISKRVRHVSCFDLTSSEMLRDSLFEAQMLRTFINYGDGLHLPSHAVGQFRYSRVLDLNTFMKPAPAVQPRILKGHLPPSLDNLKHIRYLDLSRSTICMLPISLTCLYYLQTLILTLCEELEELPIGLRYLTNLRHLDIRGCSMLTRMPPRMGQLTCLQELTHFIVSKHIECSGIGELQNLDLRGRLIIENLAKIKNPTDVEQANLIGKPNLTSLELNWADSENKRATHEREIEVQILQGLQPHGNLEALMLSNYGGIQFPSWMMDTTLATLQKIKLFQCGRLNRLPPLGQLPSLKVLEIISLQNVEYIGDEIYGNELSAAFPSLEELTIRGMGKLRIWSGWKSGRIFPRLVKLKIYDCPMLTKVVLFPYSEHLTIDSSLVSGAEPLCQGMLQNLTRLKIANCTQLKDVLMRLQNLTTLKSMSLKECDLLSFPVEEMRGLISLQELTIDSGARLISFSKELHHISLLKSLKIKGCYMDTTIPNEISFLTGLQVLKLMWCGGLESLPESLGNLTSLHHLSIDGCYNITSLPEELRRLTALKALFILECPQLESRCEENIGEDWRKIQHIPHIFIRPLPATAGRWHRRQWRWHWRQKVNFAERL
ncbi:putative disease resistance protein RGA3 [Cinnamomum micranthum f. kanehirae]|uniref:Putative disease resistance protein RGA3 n=1 Tax=Cinnamomum micranthum f. kanehirae TaxID=337451 RepID=A0A3S3MHV3_9MAGN|nr:putative disease resistance protein RGA3 [Cinnamomum micranthum f. kanehirae]